MKSTPGPSTIAFGSNETMICPPLPREKTSVLPMSAPPPIGGPSTISGIWSNPNPEHGPRLKDTTFVMKRSLGIVPPSRRTKPPSVPALPHAGWVPPQPRPAEQATRRRERRRVDTESHLRPNATSCNGRRQTFSVALELDDVVEDSRSRARAGRHHGCRVPGIGDGEGRRVRAHHEIRRRNGHGDQLKEASFQTAAVERLVVAEAHVQDLMAIERRGKVWFAGRSGERYRQGGASGGNARQSELDCPRPVDTLRKVPVRLGRARADRVRRVGRRHRPDA